MERREFVRVKAALQVRYKFLRPTGEKVEERLYEGVTTNLSAGGLLLSGRLPDPAWMPELLSGKILLGLNVILQDDPAAVKAVARVAWIERSGDDPNVYPMGLSFDTIEPDDKARIQRYVIRAQIL